MTASASILTIGQRMLVTDYLAKVTVPIFYDLDGDAEALGTGTLLDVDGRLLLITAAHILEDRDIEKFASPWGRKQAPTGTWGSVGYTSPKSSDAWDVAIIEIKYPETVEAFRKNYNCLTLDQIMMPTPGATHILAGFPAELTTATGDAINQTPFAYYTEMLDHPPGDADHPNPVWDLFFRLERQGELLSGGVQDMPALQGASGCVIWELADYEGPLWTPGRALRAVGVQRSAKPGHWFRASNWLAVVPQLAHFDRRAAALLAVSLVGEERAAELLRAGAQHIPA